jgi:hypothetical protein
LGTHSGDFTGHGDPLLTSDENLSVGSIRASDLESFEVLELVSVLRVAGVVAGSRGCSGCWCVGGLGLWLGSWIQE